jgi:hypothetical protein
MQQCVQAVLQSGRISRCLPLQAPVLLCQTTNLKADGVATYERRANGLRPISSPAWSETLRCGRRHRGLRPELLVLAVYNPVGANPLNRPLPTNQLPEPFDRPVILIRIGPFYS